MKIGLKLFLLYIGLESIHAFGPYNNKEATTLTVIVPILYISWPRLNM